MPNNQFYQKMVDTIQKYEGARIEYIKNNLYDILKDKHLKYTIIEDILGVSDHTARSYINQSIKTRPSLENILRICLELDITLDDLLVENNREIGKQGRARKKWDFDTMKEFINDYESMKMTEMVEKYELAEGTIGEYYRNFQRRIERESK